MNPDGTPTTPPPTVCPMATQCQFRAGSFPQNGQNFLQAGIAGGYQPPPGVHPIQSGQRAVRHQVRREVNRILNPQPQPGLSFGINAGMGGFGINAGMGGATHSVAISAPVDWRGIAKGGVKFCFMLALFVGLTYLYKPGVFTEEYDANTAEIDNNTGIPRVDGMMIDADTMTIYLGPDATVVQRTYAMNLQSQGWTVIPTEGRSARNRGTTASVAVPSVVESEEPTAQPTPDNAKTGGGLCCPREELLQAIKDAQRRFDALYRENDYNTAFGLMSTRRDDFAALREALVRADTLLESHPDGEED